MSRWVITHNYRRHERRVANQAIFMDAGRGPVTIISEIDPAAWLEDQTSQWKRLEDDRSIVGSGKTDIVITFAIEVAPAAVKGEA